MLRLLTLSLLLAAGQAAAADIFEANKRLGRGINIGNYLEAPRGQDWGMRILPGDLDRIRKAGFDSIRLPVRWNAYAAKEPPFAIEPEFFRRVDGYLDQAEKAGLNVILNIHHYEELDKNPDAEQPRFEALWRQIAGRYAGRPDSVYFELNNEPHDKLDEAKWNAAIPRILTIVRATNPTRPVIIGPPSWNGIWALPKLRLPDDPNLIVTVHCYNPFPFTHQGAEWTDPKVRTLKDIPWNGTETERAAMRKELDLAADWSKTHRRPIFLGEFGAYSKAPMESRARWTAAMAREAEARGFSWAYWEYASGFGAFDRAKNAWRAPLLEALIPRRSGEKTSASR